LRGILGTTAIFFLVLGGAPWTQVAGQQPPSSKKTKHFSSAAVSPGGTWLVITLERMDPRKIALGSRPIETLSSSSYRIFKVTSLAKKPRSVTLNMPAVAGYVQGLESPVILDDGTVIGLKGDSHVVIWDKTGKYREKEIFQGSGFSASLAVLPGGKEILISRDPFGNKDPINEILDLKTLKVEKPAFLQGLSGRSVAWTADERYFLAAESGPGKTITVKKDDVEEYSYTTRTWRLVRVAAATNERTPLATELAPPLLVSGKDSMVGMGKVEKEMGFFRVKKARGACRLVPSLSGWQPVLSLGEEKFLLRSGKAHGIVDFGSGDEAKEPAVTPITLPEHQQIHYTAAAKGLLLSIDERNWQMVDLEGKLVWPLLLPE
jgi:hypothetical protein